MYEAALGNQDSEIEFIVLIGNKLNYFNGVQ